MAISGWWKALAGVAVCSALLCNLPTRLWLPAESATVQYLSDTSLQTVDESQRQFKVNSSNNCLVIRRHHVGHYFDWRTSSQPHPVDKTHSHH